MPGHDITPKRSSRLANRGLTPKHCGRLQYNPQTPWQTMAICGITVKRSGRSWQVTASLPNTVADCSIPLKCSGESQCHPWTRHHSQTPRQVVASRGIAPKHSGRLWPVVASYPNATAGRGKSWAHLHSLLCRPGMQSSLGATNTYWGGKRQWKMGDKLASVRTL